jgi:hypothetical protein
MNRPIIEQPGEAPVSTTREDTAARHPGLDAALRYPLLQALFQRRSRRISKGLKSVPAGSLTYESQQDPQPLSPLEEAVLIAATGTTGLTMPDRPFEETPNGAKILGTPNLLMPGRAAGSPDNAQATHFFLINDTGTYYLRRLPPLDAEVELTAELLVERATASKQLILGRRVEFPRRFPYYLDSNRFLSNLPGSTILLPIVDVTQQYINGLMYTLTEPEGHRPAIVDDRNFYLPAGTWKWIRKGFLNWDIKAPLGMMSMFRSEWEAGLLLQNLMLTLQAMGLGGWIHATITPPYLLGHPMFPSEGVGLGFRYVVPPFRPGAMLRWGTFLPKARANPVGLDGVLEGLCPPYYGSMSDAVDALVERKYGPNGTYRDRTYFERIFRPGLAEPYLREVPHYQKEVIACTKDVCNYIYERHGRFPAHVDAMYVPGIWLQAHHLDLQYYDKLFQQGYTDSHRRHEELWHSGA